MKLYYCRVARCPELFVEFIDRRHAVEHFVTTPNLEEAEFGTKEKMEWYVHQFPALEVCELNVQESMAVLDDSDLDALDIPGADVEKVRQAAVRLYDALYALNELRPTFFCDLDNEDVLSKFAGIIYDDVTDKLHIELRHVRKRNVTPYNGLKKMEL